MDPLFLEYDLYRQDNIYAYRKIDDNNVYLRRTVFHCGPFRSTGSLRCSGFGPIRNTPKNPIMQHPQTRKMHAVLYTDGRVVMDGYGSIWLGYEIENGSLFFQNNFVQKVDLDDYPEDKLAEWHSNIEKGCVDNIYGLIPENSVNIVNKNLDAFFPFFYPSWEKIVELYGDPANIRQFIEKEKKIFESGL